MNRMPCHITDGPDFEDDDPVPDYDEDAAYERLRDEELHRQMDALDKALNDIGAGLEKKPWTI